MHGLAGITNMAWAIVTGGDFLGDPRAAITAKNHVIFNDIPGY
jgi:hypothetical protein